MQILQWSNDQMIVVYLSALGLKLILRNKRRLLGEFVFLNEIVSYR